MTYFRRWLYFLGVLFLLGVVIQLPALVGFTTMLAVVLGVAALWQRYSLDGVVYRRRPHYRRAFPGERVPLRIEVENRKWLPLSWLRLRDPWPMAVAPEDESALAPSHLPDQGVLTHVFSLRWYERARREYTLLFRERGVHRVGPAVAESGDLFGIWERTAEVAPSETLTVFPALIPLEDLQLTAEDPFGDRKAQRRLFEDPNLVMGVRDYHPDDDFRRVHWSATARVGRLQVKVHQPVSARVMVLCLNVTTMERRWEGVKPEVLEHLVRVAATLAYHGVERGYQVGLISNSTLSNSDQPFRISPGRSPKQLAWLLEALAGVTPVVVTPFDRFLLREAPRLPYGATLVVVTALVSDALTETLVRLKRRGRRLILFSVAPEPPPELPGVRVIHRPFVPEGSA